MPIEALLKSFAENELLLNAVRSAILEQFKDEVTDDMDDKRIGEIVRANISGKKKVEQAFTKFQSYKTLSEEKPTLNPAR
jgi:hypothetical protein